MASRAAEDLWAHENATEVTLLDLVRTLAEITVCEEELVTTVRHLMATGQVCPVSSPHNTKMFQTD